MLQPAHDRFPTNPESQYQVNVSHRPTKTIYSNVIDASHLCSKNNPAQDVPSNLSEIDIHHVTV
jgi:hypothetical protein